eukprot:CAMPEP_0174887088 /NCGR_PEP_ID=MMETSP0167-20121228/2317_1 /TAXON_ID=38298 /ORGANISM="Rhodella maculata, Strain CCMP736" /LENGTH=33 /DNA_ID= /DNA_START= /DNA_END= /DNA_ORIENTATION=
MKDAWNPTHPVMSAKPAAMTAMYPMYAAADTAA